MNSSFKEKVILIVLAGVTLLAVLNWSSIYGAAQQLLGSMNSLFIGAIIAFILNVPMKKLEDQLEKITFLKKSKRSLAIVGVLISFALIVTVLVVIVLPTLVTTVSELVSVSSTAIPKSVNALTNFLGSNGLLSGKIGDQIIGFLNQLKNLTFISGLVTPILSGLVSNVTGLFSNTMTLVIAFFFTLAILGSKEHLQNMARKFLQAILPAKAVKIVNYIGEVIVDTYDKFLMSQIVEACIIGTLVFVSYSFSGIPYASMAGILAGVLSFVPYIGPLSACLISALFVAVQNPLLALWSIALFQLIQLIEGNVIYPRVVGQSVGLPTLFTLAAALIGGNLFGLLGMIFFTPIFAVIYRLIREWVTMRLKKQNEMNLEGE
ncbi:MULTISPECIES: AI-2E family transporter [Streptococcus]|uniref:AI-2E family transporter n=1 Tax=Streptococcus ruminantium TaxID=1917441 RepID=A0A2Z5TSQ7_9STRE|nr:MULTISPECIES: AI-2E family transporter [Streptococcus]MDQ8760146.1 AI-2E family transporter [Streptococcus ruminantium]MDQ8764459.1 AI-2E family transporter [Streptococcus ruminantium]MDQ8766798.1 AI-2E family transporter [Streptococcus ruminantium]MDQ8769426.1 AI-2E family transporter [Streptococcus ruminantium]MDQ8774939.1 AI-2E family transporter [Streptococcus ruminantium]